MRTGVMEMQAVEKIVMGLTLVSDCQRGWENVHVDQTMDQWGL